MRIGLFIPCFIDAFAPEAGVATLVLLERFGLDVTNPRDQTCGAWPMANAGFNACCADTEALFVRNFAGFDYVVSPSGSCVHHVRDNFDAIEQTDAVTEIRTAPSHWSSSCTTRRGYVKATEVPAGAAAPGRQDSRQPSDRPG